MHHFSKFYLFARSIDKDVYEQLIPVFLMIRVVRFISEVPQYDKL
jgi:hypothetical protein